MQMTQKEIGLLKDLRDQEQLCVEKYTKHTATASDAQLKNLFSCIAQTEQQHLDSIVQLQGGTVPSAGGGQSGCAKTPDSFSAAYGVAETPDKKSDCFLCSDLLATEKHASSLYDTCIFEFKDASVRSVLNHIQKEEQEHGKVLYDYMSINGMYS